MTATTWIVNGQKVWNSFAHVADWGILLARTDWDVPKHRGISYFLVDMTTPGVEARPLRQITGVAHFNETFLTDVHIPAENLLGGLNNGWGVAQTTLMNERALIGSGGSGIGFRDWIELREALRQARRPRGPPAARGALHAARAAQVARPARAGVDARPARVPGCGELGREAVRGRTAHRAERRPRDGNRRRRRDALLDRRVRGRLLAAAVPRPVGDSRIGGGTEQVQRNILGERILGLPAEPRPDKTAPFREIPRNT